MPPRIVTRELLDRLAPLEQVIAQSYLKEGRWVLDENKEGDPDAKR